VIEKMGVEGFSSFPHVTTRFGKSRKGVKNRNGLLSSQNEKSINLFTRNDLEKKGRL